MPTTLTVTHTQVITPTIRRVWFQSNDLTAFADSIFSDRYVKLLFPKPGTTYPETYAFQGRAGKIPAEDLPTMRTYTVLHPNLETRTLAIDFVLHGDRGLAGPWAATAKAGDELLAKGPGGAYRPDPTADWHLLIGDESALPAITGALLDLPRDAKVHVVALVDSPNHRPDLPLPSAGTVTWLYRSEGDTATSEALRNIEWLPGRVHVFAHGEAQDIMHWVRPHLLGDRGLSRDQVSISGYWRAGRDEEAFRGWKAELAAAESSAR